jgi:hypothetical protein
MMLRLGLRLILYQLNKNVMNQTRFRESGFSQQLYEGIIILLSF